MSVGIECPVCEAVFAVKQVSSKTGIRCPECKRKFRYSEAVLADKKSANLDKEKPAKKPTSKKSTPTKSKPAKENTNTGTSQAAAEKPDLDPKKSKWKTVATEAPRLQTPQPVHDSDPASASSGVLDRPSTDPTSSDLTGELELGQAEPKLSAAQAYRRQKVRRQTRNAVLVIATLSIVTAILGFLLYRQLSLPANQLAGDSGSANTNQAPINSTPLPPSPSDPQQNKSGVGPTAEPDDPDEDEKPIELPRVLADDLPSREFEYLRKSELRSLWKRIRPRLLSLAVRTDLGIEPSVGTIVDSRGWALTSNQLVSKWPDVSATASARNIDAYYADLDARKQTDDKTDKSPASQTLLTDVSRGIASTQPKRDQTLLAVNTRFVVSLDKFVFSTRNHIVAGMYLVQAAPPSPTNPYGFEEVEVHGRQEFEELETAALNKAKALGIDDPLTTWVVTSKKASPLVGTPVFTRDSKMVGTFAFSTKQFAYFVMSDQATNLIAQAAQSGAEKGKLQQVKVTIPLLSPSHSMARPSELLNRAGVACEAFGWIPDKADQYKQLQKFSRRFSTIAKFIQDNQDDASDSVSLSILSDQIKRWQRSLSTSIRDSYKQDSDKIFLLNAISIDKLTAPRPNTANTYIPFVAEFYQRGRDKNDQDAILMTLNEDQAVVKLPFSGRIRGMRPGSLWLCFYKRPSELKRILITLGSGEVAPLYDGGSILTVLGPIEKR